MNPSTPSGRPASGFAGGREQYHSYNMQGIGPTGTDCLPLVESGPVFADPSGRRHRVLRYAGRAAVACLAACLGAVVVAMTGGPQAPFTQWAVQPRPASHAHGHASASSAGRASRAAGRAASGPSQNAPAAAPGASAPAPTSLPPSQGASPSAQPSASATASTSAAAVNPARKTPPGHSRSRNPHSSASAA